MWGSTEALRPPEELRPPGWCELGMEYTLAEPHRNDDVTKAIEALDPTFTPIGIRWIWLAPADAQTGVREVHKFVYHGIGRRDLKINTPGWTPEEIEESQRLLMLPSFEIPPSYKGRIPKYLDPTVGILDEPGFLGIESVFQAPRDKFQSPDLPGPFIPWDWTLVNALKRCYTSEHSIRQLKESMLWTPYRRKKTEAARQRRDYAMAMVDFQAWANRKVEAASDDEIVQEMARTAERARQARLKRLAMQMNFKLHGVN